MVVRFELFHTGKVAPERLWGVVGDPWRLAEWTDVESVADVTPDPPVLGTKITTVEAGTTRTWQITTLEARLLEMWTATERGEMGMGCRVVRDARGGSRLVLAAGVEVHGIAGDLRARLLHAPSLRRRMDRWSAEALRVAALPTG
jgi:hypothetical protein